MNKTTTTALIILAFTTGITIANTPTKHVLTYNHADNKEKHNFPPRAKINYTGTIKTGDYTIHFNKEKNNPILKGATTGYTYPGGKKEIWIETGKEASKIEETCDHEIFHEQFPDFRHPKGLAKYNDPVYKYSDDAQIWECDLATELALKKTKQLTTKK